MNFRISYIIPLLVLSAKMFCQDFLIKKDSVRLEVKLLEVKPDELKYKLFNYQDGPDIIIEKNDVAYVIYSNGVKEVINSKEPPITDNIFVNPTPPKGSVRKPDSIGNYIKFNIQLGAVINNAYSNFTNRKPKLSHTSDEEYSGNNDEKYFTNLNVGFNFLFGRSPYIKHIIGMNYLRSEGEFNYDFYSAGSDGGHGGYTNSHVDFHYKSTLDFLNIVTGIRFAVGKHLSIEPQVAFNYLAKDDERITGTITTSTISGGPTTYITNTNVEYINNKDASSNYKKIYSTVSFCPKLSYEFKIKQQAVGLYFSYNMALQYRLPWYLCGLTYYPLKKLSPNIDNKKIKLFTKIKVSADLGITLNNSLTTIPTTENSSANFKYDGFKATNKNIQTGINMGINIISGANSYCKHLINLSYVQSKTEFIRKSYNENRDQDKIYKYTRDLNVKSTTHFVNFGTGIRFILYKHLNIDNSLLINFPLASLNKYDGFEYYQEYTYNGTSTFGIYYQTSYLSQKINASKSSEVLFKYALAYSPKVSYDFKIKQQPFGIYYNFNFAFKQKIQWHMLGITYYPFKNLR